MNFLTKPWENFIGNNDFSFELENSLNAVLTTNQINDLKFVTLSNFKQQNFVLFPYPKN